MWHELKAVRAHSIFVDLLLLCGVPVLVAADALVGVTTAMAVAVLVLHAVYHMLMQSSVLVVRTGSRVVPWEGGGL